MINVNLNMVLEHWYINSAQIIAEVGRIPFNEIQWVYDGKPVSVTALPGTTISNVEELAISNFVISNITE